MTRYRGIWFAALAIMGCHASAAGYSAASTPLRSAGLVGTWHLLSRIDLDSVGGVRTEPVLGNHPLATLIYDRAGHVAAQLMARDRVPADCGRTTATDPNNSTYICRYDAYFGRYEVTYRADSSAGTVTHIFVGALAPSDVGRRVTRDFQLAGDTLTIRFAARGPTNEPVTRTLVWQRVSP